MRTILLCVIALLLSGVRALAQVRADPGVVIGNRVAVRVNVTLADDETSYYPVRGLALAFARTAADTVNGRTDEAGVLTLLLPPGEYVVSSARVPWKGAWYIWSVPIDVRPDMRAVDLNRRNARTDRSGRSIAVGPRTVQNSGDVNSGDASSSRARSDNTIRWLSIEVGGEGGLTRLGTGTGSDAGYGGAGSFVAGIGPLAVGLGYRYTRLRYGGDLNPGSLTGATA